VPDADRNGAIRVLLCDDALGFPRLVASWLARGDEFEYLGLADSATELLEIAPGLAPDVVLLDYMLPEGPASPELLARIRGVVPGVRIVLISSLNGPELAAEAARVGADAHCPRATRAEALLAVIAAAGRPPPG
jgi:DNA-binding NarL/FixJ family response regulator